MKEDDENSVNSDVISETQKYPTKFSHKLFLFLSPKTYPPKKPQLVMLSASESLVPWFLEEQADKLSMSDFLTITKGKVDKFLAKVKRQEQKEERRRKKLQHHSSLRSTSNVSTTDGFMPLSEISLAGLPSSSGSLNSNSLDGVAFQGAACTVEGPLIGSTMLSSLYTQKSRRH